MAGTLQKVSPGDPLRIPATTFNTFIDVARDHQQRQHDARRRAQHAQLNTGIVAVLNESGADRERFDVLGISGVIIKPADNAEEFQQRVTVRGVVPTSAHVGRFVVLFEPLSASRIGQALIDGVCVARVRMDDEDHQHAEIAAGDAAQLYSGANGSAQLLWVEPVEDRADPEVAWAVVRLGGGDSAGGVASAAFARITSKSGTEPPYRYAAAQGAMDEDGNWSSVGGGEVYNNVFNLEEQGAGGQWVNPLVVGDVVLIFAAPDPTVDAFVCTRSHYRGTY